jgi:uncharacterized protein with FMN-binding domain
MPKRPVVATVLTVAALALLLSFKTPQVAGLAITGATGTGSGSSSGTVSGNKGTYSGQVTGKAVQIPFGTVQVQVTFQNGKITDVQALQLPSGGGHTGQISSYAGPQLRSEVLTAQSAQIDTVSGATYTSEGYIQSLQSALSQAGA